MKEQEKQLGIYKNYKSLQVGTVINVAGCNYNYKMFSPKITEF